MTSERCADCGRVIPSDPIVLSPTEVVCQDCWPFLLRPIPNQGSKAVNSTSPEKSTIC